MGRSASQARTVLIGIAEALDGVEGTAAANATGVGLVLVVDVTERN